MRVALFLVAALLTALAAGPALATATASLCGEAIRDAERRAQWLPEGLLYAIALTESAHRPQGHGSTVPWPWTINSPKGSFYLGSRGEAVAKVEELKALGVSNIDVGCMQINLHYHPDAFPSLDDAFHPPSNVAYAVRYLTELEGRNRTLFDTVGRYHSGTPWRKHAYARKVFARWSDGSGYAVPPEPIASEPAARRVVERPSERRLQPPRSTSPAPWQRVYGSSAAAGSAQTGVLQRSGTGSWLRRDDRATGVPRGPGQITFR
jgi:hypothetical protein